MGSGLCTYIACSWWSDRPAMRLRSSLASIKARSIAVSSLICFVVPVGSNSSLNRLQYRPSRAQTSSPWIVPADRAVSCLYRFQLCGTPGKATAYLAPRFLAKFLARASIRLAIREAPSSDRRESSMGPNKISLSSLRSISMSYRYEYVSYRSSEIFGYLDPKDVPGGYNVCQHLYCLYRH